MARIATSTKPPLDPGGFRHNHQEHSGGFRHNHQARSDPAAPAGSVRSRGWRGAFCSGQLQRECSISLP
ncbi:MAG: hypothetical protein WKF51_01785, partial [Geodermatophilaceae bacterium]